MRCVPRVDRIKVKYACHAVAVAHREAAGVDLGFAEQFGIQHAEYVMVGGQMKGFSQRKAVEQREQLAAFAAADVRLRSEAALRHSRQSAECADRVFSQRGLGGQRIARDLHRAGAAEAIEGIAARGDDDLAEFSGRRCKTHFRIRGRLASRDAGNLDRLIAVCFDPELVAAFGDRADRESSFAVGPVDGLDRRKADACVRDCAAVRCAHDRSANEAIGRCLGAGSHRKKAGRTTVRESPRAARISRAISSRLLDSGSTATVRLRGRSSEL